MCLAMGGGGGFPAKMRLSFVHSVFCFVFTHSIMYCVDALALSIWQCKILYPIVQFYILLCTYICYHPRLGYFRNFCVLFCVPVLWSVSSCVVVLCLRHILDGTQWTKIWRPSRGNGYRSQPRCHFLPSTFKKTDNVDCHVATRNHLRNVLFNILWQSWEMVTGTPWITCNTD